MISSETREECLNPPNGKQLSANLHASPEIVVDLERDETISCIEVSPVSDVSGVPSTTVSVSSGSEVLSHQGIEMVRNDGASAGMADLVDSQSKEIVSSPTMPVTSITTNSSFNSTASACPPISETQSFKSVSSSFLCVPGLNWEPPDPVREEKVLFHTERQ